MADIAVTAANVKPGAGAQFTAGGKGGTLEGVTTAGQALYLKADGKYALAKANTATAPLTGTTWPPETAFAGIAMTGGAADQPCLIQTGGVLNIGGTTVKGEVYVVSPNNAGGVAPIGDLLAAQAPPHWLTVIGYALDALGNIQLNPLQTNVAR